ncbi:unnamed protein product [Lota lota]
MGHSSIGSIASLVKKFHFLPPKFSPELIRHNLHGTTIWCCADLGRSHLYGKGHLWECVWMMAGLSSLAWLSLIGIWGWVRLHTCTLSNQCAQVKPAISTHTRGVLLDGNNTRPCIIRCKPLQ